MYGGGKMVRNQEPRNGEKCARERKVSIRGKNR
jgi:hypothetical protein